MGLFEDWFSGISRLAASAFGERTEKRAARFLEKEGYEILEKNFRCREGEIDIVAREGSVLVFCEVKGRRNAKYGSALEGITQSKIKKIRTTAGIFMKRKGIENVDVRFDVVAVDYAGGKTGMELVRNAF